MRQDDDGRVAPVATSLVATAVAVDSHRRCISRRGHGRRLSLSLFFSVAIHVALFSLTFGGQEHERCLAWNAPDLAINWPISGAPILSAKDAAGLRMAELAL